MAKFLSPTVIVILLSSFQYFCNCLCINEDVCLCELDDHKRIDLTPLSQTLTPGNFLEDEDASGNSFFFHGCKDELFNVTGHHFHINGTQDVFPASFVRVNVTSPLNATNVTNGVLVGRSNQIKFHLEKDLYQLIYSNGDNVIARIDLVCISYGQSFIKIISNDAPNPILTLNSPFACLITDHPGLSTGSVFLLIFFITLAIYFIGGCLIMYVMRGARGLEVIPNIDFWRSVPGLMRDGIIFLFSGCNASSITTPETYDRI